MTDPYRILGVAPNASESEIKAAYKKLVKKYHPDRYTDEDMARLANEKMSEINTAYDRIMEERRIGGAYSGSSYSGNTYTRTRKDTRSAQKDGSSASWYSYETHNTNYTSFDAYRVREMMNSGDVNGADNVLMAVADGARNAEWYYLKGMVSYQRGWFNEAYNYIARATRMDPANQEYSAAFQQMNRQRSGYMTGNMFAGASPSVSPADPCSILQGLCIADCCCELCGGDLIPCC